MHLATLLRSAGLTSPGHVLSPRRRSISQICRVDEEGGQSTQQSSSVYESLFSLIVHDPANPITDIWRARIHTSRGPIVLLLRLALITPVSTTQVLCTSAKPEFPHVLTRQEGVITFRNCFRRIASQLSVLQIAKAKVCGAVTSHPSCRMACLDTSSLLATARARPC